MLVIGLVVLAGIVGPAPIETGGVATASATPSDANETYVVEQGTFCQPIEPLETNDSVESFYDYRNHETHPEDVDRQYSSYGTQHLQADDTSILMLHEGPDGLSLVMVHDRLDGETSGGIVTFDIVGTPADAEWVVQDDKYDSVTNMAEWYHGDGWLGASWIWTDARTDGGAIQGGLDDAFALTIQPAFNEASPFYNNDDLHDPDWHNDGEIEQWEVLSGDSQEPDRTRLPSLAEPVTIRTGTCDEPSVTYDRSDDGVDATIGAAAANGSGGLQPVAGSSDAVQFDTIELSDVDPDGTISPRTSGTDQTPALPDDVDALSTLALASDMNERSGTITFSVDADRLHQDEIEAEDVSLFEADGDDWHASDPVVREETDDTYEFEASITSLDGLAVTILQETASDSGGGSSTDDESQIGDESEVEAQTGDESEAEAQTGDEDEAEEEPSEAETGAADEADATDSVPERGLAIVAIVGILLFGATAWRRWEENG